MRAYRIRLEREGYNNLWFRGVQGPFESPTHYRFTPRPNQAFTIKGERSTLNLINQIRKRGGNMDRIVMEVWDEGLQAFIDVLSIG